MSAIASQTSEQQELMQAARVDLAAAHRLAAMDGFNEGTWNHFSLTVPGTSDRMLVSPPYVHWSQVTASSLEEFGAEADEVEARGDAEWISYRIHYPLHQIRGEDATCVLHVHTPNTVALAMLEDGRLEMAEQNALYFHDRVAYTDEYDGAWPADLNQGELLAAALGGTKTVLMMKNHGAIVIGRSVAEAYTDLYLLDRACGAQLLAWSTGRRLALVPDAVTRAVSSAGQEAGRAHARLHFEAMKRVLDARQPDYRG